MQKGGAAGWLLAVCLILVKPLVQHLKNLMLNFFWMMAFPCNVETSNNPSCEPSEV